MINRSNFTKKISIITALSLFLTYSAAYGSENYVKSESNDSAVNSSESCDPDVAEVLLAEKEYVDSHEKGVDYVENQAFFEAETEEEAKKIAE